MLFTTLEINLKVNSVKKGRKCEFLWKDVVQEGNCRYYIITRNT